VVLQPYKLTSFLLVALSHFLMGVPEWVPQIQFRIVLLVFTRLLIIRLMLWTVTQVAKFLQCSTRWVYRHKHELPLIRVGGMIRFDSDRDNNCSIAK